jgi:hypothetical protein
MDFEVDMLLSASCRCTETARQALMVIRKPVPVMDQKACKI